MKFNKKSLWRVEWTSPSFPLGVRQFENHWYKINLIKLNTIGIGAAPSINFVVLSEWKAGVASTPLTKLVVVAPFSARTGSLLCELAAISPSDGFSDLNISRFIGLADAAALFGSGIRLCHYKAIPSQYPANPSRIEYWRRVEARLWPSITDEGQHRAFPVLEGASLQRSDL